MKKTCMLLTLILTTLIISCCESSSPDKDSANNPAAASTGTDTGRNYKSFLDKKKGLNKDNHPFEELEAAKRYIAFYQEHRPDLLSQLEGGNRPTTSLWIDAETIAHFYSLCQNENASGMRIYFSRYDGNYPDPLREQLLGANVNQKTSIVMVSTMSGITGHDDYYRKDPQTGYYIGLYNYNDPCPPAKCEGTTLDDGTKRDSTQKKK